VSRYRWLEVRKCLERLECLPALKGKEYEELEALLHDAVKRGAIAVLLNDVEIPKEHIAVYLSLFARAYPEQPSYKLPYDAVLSLDHLYAVFDRPSIDSPTRGRPRKDESGWSEDHKLAAEMHRMIAGHPRFPRARTATEAARILLNAGRILGAGTPESKIKRLVRVFRKYYTS
jgi:hypothetical protein